MEKKPFANLDKNAIKNHLIGYKKINYDQLNTVKEFTNIKYFLYNQNTNKFEFDIGGLYLKHTKDHIFIKKAKNIVQKINYQDIMIYIPNINQDNYDEQINKNNELITLLNGTKISILDEHITVINKVPTFIPDIELLMTIKNKFENLNLYEYVNSQDLHVGDFLGLVELDLSRCNYGAIIAIMKDDGMIKMIRILTPDTEKTFNMIVGKYFIFKLKSNRKSKKVQWYSQYLD
jgi:uncharacterized protein YlzI (FlbEa/FlbD family)